MYDHRPWAQPIFTAQEMDLLGMRMEKNRILGPSRCGLFSSEGAEFARMLSDSAENSIDLDRK